VLRRIVLPLAALLVAVQLNACGTTSVDDYEAKQQKIGDRLKPAADRAAARARSGDLAGGLGELRQVMIKMADEIEQLDPPSGDRSSQDEWVAQVRRVARDADDGRRAARRGDAVEVERALKTIQSDVERLDQIGRG
jgi:hypothetical protein